MEDDISQMISDFSFFNSLFKKFQTVFENLQIQSPSQKNQGLLNISLYQKAYWTLYILSHKQILDKRSQIIDSLCLLGAVFLTMLRNKEMFSLKIAMSDGSKGLVGEICDVLIIKDFKRFESLLNDYVAFLQTLRLKEVLRVKWYFDHKILVIFKQYFIIIIYTY